MFFPDLRSLFGEDELYKIFNISVLATPWEGTKNVLNVIRIGGAPLKSRLVTVTTH